MNTETIIEAIPKDIFTFKGLKTLVYDVIQEKSTPMHPLELKDLSCVLSWSVPRGVTVKNADNYMYLIIQLEGDDG